MELIVEDYNAVATAGQSLEMVFRTDLAYDDCQFVTPQVSIKGNFISRV